jgi:4-carboxymuconolactone decarboxylase
MARVPYLKREELSPEHQASYDRIADTRGVVGPNFQALFNSPIATERFASWGEYLRFDSEIPPRLKELVILAAAREANNGYVWTAHERLAREQGVTDAVIDAIRHRSAPAGLAGDDASVVGFAKELLINSEISDETFAAVHQLLGDKATVDLTLLILYYSSLALALQAVRVELPEGVASTL